VVPVPVEGNDSSPVAECQNAEGLGPMEATATIGHEHNP